MFLLKKLTVLFLVMAMFMTSGFDASAALIMDYLPGPYEYTLTEEFITDMNNAESDDESVKISGGEVNYYFNLPFDVESISFYSLSNFAGVTILLDGEPIAITEETDEEKVAVLENALRKDVHTLTLKSASTVEISKILFTKHKHKISEEVKAASWAVSLSEQEDAIQTAVIFRTDASMHIVNGGRRYNDNYNITLKPLVIDGTTYIPAHTFARALSCYYEEIPENKYVLLRREGLEFAFAEDVCYKYEFNKSHEYIDNKIKYVGETAYVPLRYFAEGFGECVGYEDGLIVIDENEFYVSDILDNDSVTNYVNKKFEDFKKPGKAGTTYHVAQTANASDSNPGTAEQPFKTLNKAGSIVKAGDTVIVHNGTYRETLKVKNDGTALNPITFVAAEGETPVISATEAVNTFVKYGDNMVCSVVPWDLGDGRNQIFHKGESVLEARYPNGPTTAEKHDVTSPISDNWFVFGDIQVDAVDNYLATSETLLDQEEEDYWKGAYFVALRGNAYGTSTARVASSKKGELRLEDTSINYWDVGQTNTYNTGYLAGHMNCLDAPGEWIMQDGYLFMIPPEGETANTLKLEVKKRMLVADIADNKYLHIKGIDMFGGSMRMNNSEMCMIQDCEIKYNNHFTLSEDQNAGYIDGTKNKGDNSAPQRGELGIFVGGRDNIFIDNHFKEAAATAIYSVGLHMYIENNVIDACGYQGSYVGGITIARETWKDAELASGGHGVYHNSIFNVGRACWYITRTREAPGVWPLIANELAYNDFHDAMFLSQDTGIVYSYHLNHGNDRLKTKFHNNYIYYTTKNALPYSLGIYWDGGSQNIDTYENVTFTTQIGTKYTSLEGRVFTQLAANSFAYCDSWNNETRGVVLGGPEALDERDFPNGMPYFAGAMQTREEPYLVNYERRHSPASDLIHYAKDAELSEGVVIEDGKAVLSSEEQWIKFSNVNFAEKSNIISLLYSADKYHADDGQSVGIYIDSPDSDNFYNFIYTTFRAAKAEDTDVTYLTTRGLTGVHDVYLKVKNNKSLKIIGITADGYNTDSGSKKRAADVIYGGTYDDYTSEINLDVQPTYSYGACGDGANPYLKGTPPGTVFIYDNLPITKEMTSVTLTWASAGESGNQPCQIRIGDRHAEPIAELRSPDIGWHDYVDTTVDLKEPLQPGTYTVYLTFDRDDGSNIGSSNFYRIKFE